MKMHLALVGACAGMFILAQTDLARAQAAALPIPGINIVIKKCGGGPCPTKANPSPPAKPKSAITTSRSNIKHNGGTP
jgi:hypothetical protein